MLEARLDLYIAVKLISKFVRFYRKLYKMCEEPRGEFSKRPMRFQLDIIWELSAIMKKKRD